MPRARSFSQVPDPRIGTRRASFEWKPSMLSTGPFRDTAQPRSVPRFAAKSAHRAGSPRRRRHGAVIDLRWGSDPSQTGRTRSRSDPGGTRGRRSNRSSPFPALAPALADPNEPLDVRSDHFSPSSPSKNSFRRRARPSGAQHHRPNLRYSPVRSRLAGGTELEISTSPLESSFTTDCESPRAARFYPGRSGEVEPRFR